MSKRNEAPILIISLLVTLGLLGAGGWWLSKQLGFNNSGANPSAPSMPNGNPTRAVSERISFGEKQLIAASAAPAKQEAIANIQSGNFPAAVSTLESYLQQNRNDPEALIYLNNARIGQANAYVLMVSVPAQTDPNPAQEILRGVAQVQQEINQQGGINGTPLKIGIASDDNDPAMAEKVAQALVDTPSVLGVIGHFGSETTLAASAIYEQGQLPVISPTSTSVKISEVGEYVFRTVPSDRFTASTLSRHLINDLSAQQVAVYYNAESDYSQSLKNEFTTALYADGGQVALEVNAADAGFNASGSIAQAQQQGAQAIALLTNTATLDQAIQVVQANSGQLQLVGGDSLYNPKLLEIAGSAAAGMDIAVPWILLSNPQSTYAQSSRQLWGGDVNWRTAMAYDATIALAVAIKQNPSRSGIQAALSQSGFQVEGATGMVQFLPSGDRNQAMQLVTVAAGNRSSYGYDFVPAD
ncbi:MAG: ABC transporter substrate-binding protein [Elainellaceae cyanobacterium]